MTREDWTNVYQVDFPTVGQDDAGLYITAFRRKFGGGFQYTNGGQAVIVIDKQRLYNEDTLEFKMLHSEDGTPPTNTFKTITVQPVDNLDPHQGPVEACFLAKKVKVAGEASGIYYRFVVWDGDSIQTAHWTNDWLALPRTNYLDYFDLEGSTNGNAPQLDVHLLIQMGNEGSRLHNAVCRQGVIWTCQDIGLDGTDGDYDDGTVDRTGIQWLQLQITNLIELELVGPVKDQYETVHWRDDLPSGRGFALVGSRGIRSRQFGRTNPHRFD